VIDETYPLDGLGAAGQTTPTHAGIRASRDAVVRRMLATGDAAAILSALFCALVVGDLADLSSRLRWGAFSVPLFLVTFKVYGLYDRDTRRITHSTVDDLPRLFHATVIASLLFWLYARYTPMGKLYFWEILTFGVGVLVLVTCARFLVRSVLARRIVGRDRAVVVGTGDVARTLAAKIAGHPEFRLDLIGSLRVDGGDGRVQFAAPLLGDVDELETLTRRYDITRVMFSMRDLSDARLQELLQRCRALALKVSMLPRLADMLGPSVEIDDVEGVTVLGMNPPWLPRSSRALKRAMDLVIAGCLLILVAPLLLILAALVKLDSRGSVLFSQERVGKSGQRFRVLKFRTMVSDAEAQRAKLLAQSTDPDWLKLDHDPRITRLGSWLRRLSLDELPQLWNVVRGEMSLVGPRPLIPCEDERVKGWARGRLDLTPGITGYWQVLGRTRISFEEMVKLDYLYVMNWSLWEDIRLMLRTMPVVLSGRGSN